MATSEGPDKASRLAFRQIMRVLRDFDDLTLDSVQVESHYHEVLQVKDYQQRFFELTRQKEPTLGDVSRVLTEMLADAGKRIESPAVIAILNDALMRVQAEEMEMDTAMPEFQASAEASDTIESAMPDSPSGGLVIPEAFSEVERANRRLMRRIGLVIADDVFVEKDPDRFRSAAQWFAVESEAMALRHRDAPVTEHLRLDQAPVWLQKELVRSGVMDSQAVTRQQNAPGSDV